MSDNTQPASSRRALREKRRAEMEALLASSKAEKEAREAAVLTGQLDSIDPSQDPATEKPEGPAKTPEAKPQPSAKKPASAASPKKPATQPSASPAAPSAKPSAAKPEAKKPAPAPSASATKSAGKDAPAKPAQGEKQQAGEPPVGERASLRRARDREALRERRRLQEEVSALTTNVPTVESSQEPKPLTRRQLRLQALAEQQKQDSGAAPKATPKPSKPQEASEQEPETTVMSVEEALAARRKLAPKPPIDPNLLGDDDHDIDLEVLAHQREMAARAAIISRRAAERERLRQENVKAGKETTSPDPFTGAMGNIRDLEDKVARSGVSGPQTASVSLDLDSTGKIPPAKKPTAHPAPKKPAAKPAATPQPKPASARPAPKSAASKPAAKPSAPQSAAASAASDDAAYPEVDLPRVQAVQAQGLQPLDAQTAGVRRANNMFLAMIAALAIGGIALITGLIMILGN